MPSQNDSTLQPDAFRAVAYGGGVLCLLDQRRLPAEEVYVECRGYQEVAEAIRTLAVRGAPAIGLAAAFGVVLAARELARRGVEGDAFKEEMVEAISILRGTRPTAVNLFWALDRMEAVARAAEQQQLVGLLEAEADRMMAEDAAACRSMTAYGADLIPDGAGILTHCNTGALVTSTLGTALGAIRRAHESGKRLHVWVDETRPLLQGARLTAWELGRLGIPHTLITDSMAGHFMARGNVDLVMVGADRICANGDTANKIGTYAAAVLARAHGIPFYVVAPTSTVDLALAGGNLIPIEERNPEEVAGFRGVRTAPADTPVANPAFDVTPAALIAGIVTEEGVARPPYLESLSGRPDQDTATA